MCRAMGFTHGAVVQATSASLEGAGNAAPRGEALPGAPVRFIVVVPRREEKPACTGTLSGLLLLIH